MPENTLTDLEGQHPDAFLARLKKLEEENLLLRSEFDNLSRHRDEGDHRSLELIEDIREQLQRRNRELRSILDNMPSMIGYWDKNLTNRFGNHAYFEWFGVKPAEMPGKHINEVIGDRLYKLNQPYIEGALRGERQQFERAIPNPHTEGKVRYSLANYIPDIVNGVVQGFFVLVSDITERKEVEVALSASRSELERRVQERTEELRQLTVQISVVEERERQAIARDLHDDLGQTLHVIKLKLDQLGKQAPSSLQNVIADMDALLTDANVKTRSLISQLSPPVLERLGLGHALKWLCEEMHRLYGLDVAFSDSVGDVELSPTTSAILFRAARELLINVIKHSGKNVASLHVLKRDKGLELIVEDGGVGIIQNDHDASFPKGFGLTSIQERMKYLGGDVQIVSSPNSGTKITLFFKLPIPENINKEST